MCGVTVYDWHAWEWFLASSVFPSATRLRAVPGEAWQSVVEKMDPAVRFFLFHCNLTQTHCVPLGRGELIEELQRRAIRPLNGAVVDIRRSTIQQRCRELGLNSTAASAEGNLDEPLIIKTDRNCGGITERYLSRGQMARLGLVPRHSSIQGTRDYRILRRREVPPTAWTDPLLHVERYISNAASVYYRVYLLGAKVATSVVTNPAPIKKLDRIMKRRNVLFDIECGAAVADLPDSLIAHIREFSKGFHLDFGALDIMADEAGAPYIVDVNTTPYWGNRTQRDDRDGDSYGGILDHLRSGIESLG